MKNIYHILRLFVLVVLWHGASAQAPYCIPTYTTGCQIGDGLTGFYLGDIAQVVDCNGNPNPWYNFNTATTDLTIGGNHQLTVYAGSSSTYVNIWIDLNDNNLFDVTEKLVDGFVCTYANSNFITNLAIPVNAPAGIHRLRFRTNYASPPSDPCSGLTYGNSGDFMVNLVNPPLPVAAVVTSPPDATAGVLLNADLSWTAGSGIPVSGYYLFLGTDNPPTNMVNGSMVSNPYYNPSSDFALNTTYYWKVVPFNSAGQAASVPVWSFSTIAGYGSVQGQVLNAFGVPLSGVNVTISGPDVFSTVSDAGGNYQFLNVPPGTYSLSGQAVSYNTTSVSGLVVTVGNATSQNLVMLQPSMSVLPNPANVSLNPNEEYLDALSVSNSGFGMLGWTAAISYGSAYHDWFSMPVMSGSVSPTSVAAVPMVYNASGLTAGTVLNATVTFTSVPDVGTQVIPVTMTVSGATLVPATNVQAVLTDQLTGAVNVSWECTPGAGFLYYIVKRNGIQVASIASDLYFADYLPAYGVFDYCVQAVYTEGNSSSSCFMLEWPSPALTWSPSELIAYVWPSTFANVVLTLGNTGLGTLAFEFPEYVDHMGDSPLAYCAASGTTEDEFIAKVQIGTINNSSGWTAYSDFTSFHTELGKNMPYPVTVNVGPPSYSGDVTGIWIDYDHNNSFDANEFTALTGTGIATGLITVPSSALPGFTTMRVRTQYNGTLSPCGITAYGEVEDYTVEIKDPTFITSVSPASGFLPPGTICPIVATFSSSGIYTLPGVYTTTLKLHSNDLNHPSVNIPATMIVGLAAYLTGVVTDAVTGEPLAGVEVSAGSGFAMTNDIGYYSILLNPGTYSPTFTKLGYQTVTVPAVVTTGGNTTTLDAQMSEQPYPPACAYASVNFEDTQCTVSWCLPAGPYELIYDDGTAENYAGWLLAGNMNAVKFTPQGYPATVIGAKFFIGSGMYGNALGSPFTVLVCKPDAAGLPGEVIDSVATSVTNTGWLTVAGLSASVTGGDFFIVLVQGSLSPDCAYLGVDETLPKAYKSYSRNISNGGVWGVSPYQDFMIRAIVSSPVSGDDDKAVYSEVVPVHMEGMLSHKLPDATAGMQGMKAMVEAPVGFDNPGAVITYTLARCFLGSGNPVPPGTSPMTLINNYVGATTFVEGFSSWGALAQGWYAYGIKAVYPNGQQSEFAFTNLVPHKMFSDLTVNAELVCGFVPAEGAIVKLSGINYPYDFITDTISAAGTAVFSHIIKGEYTVLITYPGHDIYNGSVSLQNNQSLDVVLEKTRYKPRNLFVDASTLVATWEAPLDIVLAEDFESGVFPPANWQATTQGSVGWFATNAGNFGLFALPLHTTYVMTNDGDLGSGNNGCCDYLVTPEVDLTNATGYMLGFQSFYLGDYGQMGFVEMSTDNGVTWTPIYTCLPSGDWQQVNIDLSTYSGNGGLAAVRFAFHADDGGNWTPGWAVDDVIIKSGDITVDGYGLFTNGTEFGQTTELTANLPPEVFSYGQSNTLCVAALYCNGYSEGECYSFTSYFLYPPLNLKVAANVSTTSGAAILTWEPPLNAGSNLLYYMIYRDDVSLVQVPATDTVYWDMGLPPHSYCYSITAAYDVTTYGFPGMAAESAKEGPECADIFYGFAFPFFEDFSSGQFDLNLWTVGQNWVIDAQSDNPVPAARFKWDPILDNYSSALESFWINGTGINSAIPYKIWFDYEVKMEDQSLSATEKLTVEVWNGSSWITAKEYPNTGSFDWTVEHLDITAFAKDQSFKVRFRANGIMSGGIHYWAVDNVHIYTEMVTLPALNLVAQRLTTTGDDILLTWGSPAGGGTVMSYILDDNTVENGVYFNAPGEGWLGNEFPVSESGVLQTASVFMDANGSATYSFDVFDANHTLVGSSANFVPTFEEWTNVSLPDIPFAGKFYLMLHMVVATQSDLLALDENGPNSAADYEWYFDGSAWAKLSDFGFAPGVTFIRATGLSGDKKSEVTFSPATAGTNHISPLSGTLSQRAYQAATGSEVAGATYLGDNSTNLTGYNVYRRGLYKSPGGSGKNTLEDFVKIASVDTTKYLDMDLWNTGKECFEYYVTSVYDEGESLPSNIDWECIYTSIPPNAYPDVTLFPNPATAYIRMDFSPEVSNIIVYNSLGAVVADKMVKGETSITLNTANFAAGAYSVKFTTSGGETFSRKFVVTK